MNGVLYTDRKACAKLDESTYVTFSCDRNSINIEASDLGA